MSNSPPSSTFRQYRIEHAAQDGMLIICGCNSCRTREAYWAADLVAAGYGDLIVSGFGRHCAQCGGSYSTWTRQHYPNLADVGQIEITRPAGVEQKQLWRREWFENPPAPLKEEDVPLRREGAPGI